MLDDETGATTGFCDDPRLVPRILWCLPFIVVMIDNANYTARVFDA
jgi:hypothetical protein